MPPQQQTPPQQPLPPQPPVGPPVQPMAQLPTQAGPPPAGPKKKMLLLIVVIVISLLAGAAIAYFFLVKKTDKAGGGTNNTAQVEQNVKISDMFWEVPGTPPEGWKALQAEQGDFYYRYRSTSCTLLASQPDGMKAESLLKDQQLIDKDIDTLAQQLGQPTYTIAKTPKGTIYFDTTGKTDTKKLGLSAVEAYFPDLQTKAYMVAYINGDLALSILMHCTADDYTTYFNDAVAPFMGQFKADLLP